MAEVCRSALVGFSAEQMYHLVNDVEQYPSFLPGCVGSELHSYSGNEMVASVHVSKAGISKTFTTHNTLTPNRYIAMELVEGPFKKLQGGWRFTPLDDTACKVELQLEFEFTSKLIELAFGKIFKELASNMVQAFTQRAKEVYRG